MPFYILRENIKALNKLLEKEKPRLYGFIIRIPLHTMREKIEWWKKLPEKGKSKWPKRIFAICEIQLVSV